MFMAVGGNPENGDLTGMVLWGLAIAVIAFLAFAFVKANDD